MLTACARGVLVSSWHRGESLLPRTYDCFKWQVFRAKSVVFCSSTRAEWKWELQLVHVCPSSSTRLDRSSSGAKVVDATRGEGEPSDRVVEIPDTFLFSLGEELKKKKR